jgi:SAM-dependent methyltransferase
MADARLMTQLAVRPGMSGGSAIAVPEGAAADRARSIATESGALVEVHAATMDRLPLGDQTVDVIVVHGAAGLLAPMDAEARARAIAGCHRVLRPGGRLIAIEPGTATGLPALLRRAPADDPAYAAAGSTAAALERGGFRPVRLLADREGHRFYEGLKT